MIPSVFVQLDELPLTPNGKIDVPKLVQLKLPQTEARSVSDEPLTDMEETLVVIWKEVLKLYHISVHDNFFEIGGNSLQSIQVISQLEKKIGLRINPREFIYQTLGQLATSVERQLSTQRPIIQPPAKGSLLTTIRRKIVSLAHRK
jgi:acyl carrier protein